MRRTTTYRITVENEGRLLTVFSRSIRRSHLWLGVLCLLAGMTVFGALLVMLTPLHTLLPDHVKASRRAEQVRMLFTIDSLTDITRRNQAWIDNLMTVTDTGRLISDSIKYATQPGRYNPDSLPDATPLEHRYISSMEERERFNLSVLAPLDADGMMFSPVAANAFFTAGSRNSTTPSLMLSSDSPIQAVADGTVLASYRDSAANGFCVLVQHARGFVSAYYHLGTPLVVPGDAIGAGQPIALPPDPDSRNARYIRMRIWHNGSALIPADLLN